MVTPIQFSAHEEARLRKIVEQEVRSGRLSEWQKADRVLNLKRRESRPVRDFLAEEEATKRIRIPGQADVFKVLLDRNTTANQIRELCKQAFMSRTVTIGAETRDVEVPAWPIVLGSVLPDTLSKYAHEYALALRDPRFPRCEISRRPSNLRKQLWFLSRALAGATCGVKTRTAINLVGSLRPEQVFEESHYAKPARKQRRPKKYNLTR